jgi:hypothetical protein
MTTKINKLGLSCAKLGLTYLEIEFGYPIQNIYARFLLANTVFHLPKY